MVDTKNTAYDYLIDFVNNAKTDVWIKNVVIAYLNNRCILTDEEKESLINELVTGNPVPRQLSMHYDNEQKTGKVKLKSLYHVSGVNALADNQVIKFNDEDTVIYGLNGSGKSSYFRILQAMIGNISHEMLMPNIYMEIPKDIHAKLTYTVDGREYNVDNWNNTSIIPGLTSIRVFDSHYANGFLKKRTSDELLIQPYHLGLFSDVIELIDGLKQSAIKKVEEMKSTLKEPDKTNLCKEAIDILDAECISNEKIEYFKNESLAFDEKAQNELDETEKKYKDLQVTNFGDKKRIIDAALISYERLNAVYLAYIKKWVECSEEYHDLWEKKKKDLALSAQRKSGMIALASIPGTDSDTWKKFIVSANDYVKENNVHECPYCHRPYDENALNIVHAYAMFLNDDIELRLTDISNTIEQIKGKNSNSEKHEELTSVEGIDEALNNTVAKWLMEIKEYRINLIEATKKDLDLASLKINTSEVESEIIKLTNALIKEKDELTQSETNKNTHLTQLQEKCKTLNSKHSIKLQLDAILLYLNTKNNIHSKLDYIEKMSTKNLSKTSSSAHQELLSEQLEQRFADNLIKLGITDKTITLVGKNNKGTQQTELVMKAHKEVTAILSEGEQKVAAVALFVAEIEVSKNKSTIILDDPVTSLDHKMMEHFVEMIMSLENQVIIFTHNRMFMDLINACDLGHICRTIDSACNKNKGKHIYVYQTSSEGINRKGVIIKGFTVCSTDYLKEINEELKVEPFTNTSSVCVKIRKTIDCLIDEVIFKGQIPRRYSMKNSGQNIDWNVLKSFGCDGTTVDSLHVIFNRVSAGGLHLGEVSTENPPDKEELLKMYEQLVQISPKKS